MKPNIIAIDFHGVLTDGKITITASGTTSFEHVHVKDIAAIRELIARGYEVYVVTSSSSPIIDAYCEKVGCIKIESREKLDLFDNPYVAVGDSAFDYNMLLKAERAYCPADAEDVLRKDPKIHKLKAKGGSGCIAEILKDLI